MTKTLSNELGRFNIENSIAPGLTQPHGNAEHKERTGAKIIDDTALKRIGHFNTALFLSSELSS